MDILITFRDFFGGPLVKNPPFEAGDAGLIPGWGSETPEAAGQLNLGGTAGEPEHCSAERLRAWASPESPEHTARKAQCCEEGPGQPEAKIKTEPELTRTAISRPALINQGSPGSCACISDRSQGSPAARQTFPCAALISGGIPGNAH